MLQRDPPAAAAVHACGKRRGMEVGAVHAAGVGSRGVWRQGRTALRVCGHMKLGLRTGGTEVPPCARTRVKWSSKHRHPSVWALATSFMKTNTSRLLGRDLIGVQCASFGHLLSINVVVNDSTKLVIQGTSNPPCAQKLKLSIFAVQVYVN